MNQSLTSLSLTLVFAFHFRIPSKQMFTLRDIHRKKLICGFRVN